jgi:hypothetical protein
MKSGTLSTDLDRDVLGEQCWKQSTFETLSIFRQCYAIKKLSRCIPMFCRLVA